MKRLDKREDRERFVSEILPLAFFFLVLIAIVGILF